MNYYSVLSWGLIIILGTGAVYVYRPDLFQRLLQGTPASKDHQVATESLTAKKKAKKGKIGKDASGSETNVNQKSAEEARANKKRKIVGPVGDAVAATATNGQKKELPRDMDHNLADRDFAQQLAKAQAGTNLQSKSQQKGAAPARLAATLQPNRSEERLSTAELSTGQDADDDLSSVESPQQRPVSGNDISDMLEPGTTGPSTLRITNIPDAKKQKPAPQKFEQVLSKKKRNEQARREEQKRINQVSDQQHEQKKQDQLRRARMAAGTSNQTRANNFAATAQNAWQNKPSPVTNGQPKSSTAPLLDTFEPSVETKPAVQTQPLTNIVGTPDAGNSVPAAKSKLGENATSALAASGRENGTWTDQMSVSEEEQMKMVHDQQQEDAWEPVQNKKTKRKGRKGADTSSEASPPSSRAASLPRPTQVSKNSNKAGGITNPSQSSNRFSAVQTANSNGLQEDEWQA